MKRLLRRRKSAKQSDGGAVDDGGLPPDPFPSPVDEDAASGYRFALSAYADTVPSYEDGVPSPAGGPRSRGPARGGHRDQWEQWECPAQQQPSHGYPAQQQQPRDALAGYPSPCPTDEGRGLPPPDAEWDAANVQPTPESEAGRRRAYDLITAGGGRRTWRAIPEEPRGGSSAEDDLLDHHRGSQQQSQPAGGESDEAHAGRPANPPPDDGVGGSPPVWNASDSQRRRLDRSIQAGGAAVSHRSGSGSGAAATPASGRSGGSGSGGDRSSQPGLPAGPVLQPDAYYEEHYGDAYVDGHLKYLYPDGYQSMRPRSGPWRLSVLVFGAFLWLSVFIVGHCYDRGQERYHAYDNDDAYLAEADDDQFVIEARWCGSRSLYFMWVGAVWISVLAMSYCSIIGYVKVRDVAVANGRSQPCLHGGRGGLGRSDFYVTLGEGGDVGRGDGGDRPPRPPGGYPSYQGGTGGSGRDGPAIYQSDGQPQFWGGHIYRPTQAAVTMTNRP